MLLVLLAPLLSADPIDGITFSNSPFTDEGWNAMGARNLVLLGDPGAGNWVLHLVQLPFTALETISFGILGVGIVQARLVGLACTVATVAGVGLVVRRALGPWAAVAAGTALATSTLLLYYGRLAYLEDLEMLALVGATAVACRPNPASRWTGGLVTGALLAVAIGAKPSAAAAAAGILLGMALAARTRSSARLALVATATIAASCLGWAAIVLTVQPGALGHVIEIWPEQIPPANLPELLGRIVAFPAADNVAQLTAPLALGALGGLVAAMRLWNRLDEAQRRLAGAAVGWLLLGASVLSVASFRPNRYMVTLLPAMAILAAYLVALISAQAQGHAHRRLAIAALAVAVAAASLPGLQAYASWVSTSSHALPRLQQGVLDAVDRGAILGSVAPTLAMRVPAPIYVEWVRSDVNAGDLYARDGVRWMIADEQYRPPWAAAHATAWAERRTLFCATWGRGDRCLVRIP